MRRCSSCEFRFYLLKAEKLIGPLMASNPKGPPCSHLPRTAITSVCTTKSNSFFRVMRTGLGSLCFPRQVPYYLDHLLLHSCLHCSRKYVITSVWVQRIQTPSVSELLEEPFNVVEFSCSLWIPYLIFTSVLHQHRFHQFNHFTATYWCFITVECCAKQWNCGESYVELNHWCYNV